MRRGLERSRREPRDIDDSVEDVSERERANQSNQRFEQRRHCRPNPRVMWRRGRESNPRIAVLQTATLPLGYPAIARGAKLSSAAKRCQRRQKWGDGVTECWSNEKRDTPKSSLHYSSTPLQEYFNAVRNPHIVTA